MIKSLIRIHSKKLAFELENRGFEILGTTPYDIHSPDELDIVYLFQYSDEFEKALIEVLQEINVMSIIDKKTAYELERRGFEIICIEPYNIPNNLSKCDRYSFQWNEEFEEAFCELLNEEREARDNLKKAKLNESDLIIDDSLFKLGLNATEILVMAQIMELETMTGDCSISNETLAEHSGASISTIVRCLKELEAKGLIVRETKIKANGGKERHIRTTLPRKE